MITSHRVPLLRDWHTHPMLYAAFRRGLDLGPFVSEETAKVVERVRQFIPTVGDGWAIVFGWNSARHALSAEAFDDLPPVVIFNLSLHGLILNKAGQARLDGMHPGTSSQLNDPEWIERNLRRLLNIFATEGVTPDHLRDFFRWLLNEHGVYAVDEMLLVDANEINLFDRAGLSKRVRFWASPDVYDAMPRELQARVQGIKLFTDGAIGAWTAALHQPYVGSDQCGMLIYSDEQLIHLFERYAKLPMAIHAIGDRAIDQVVAALDRVRAIRQAPVRIEHAQFISRPTAQRARELGVILSMQPNFSDDSVHYSDRLPPEMLERNNPFRMLIDVVGFRPGVDLLFGSDGMPHGVREAFRQGLFPAYAGQRLGLEELTAGYCLPNTGKGSIVLEVDHENRRVNSTVIDAPPPPVEINNRPELVWAFGFIRMAGPVLYVGTILGWVALVQLKLLDPAWILAMPLVLLGLVLLDRSTLLDPVARLRLGKTLKVNRVVKEIDVEPKEVRRVRIVCDVHEGVADYATGNDRHRDHRAMVSFHKNPTAYLTITWEAAQHLIDWAEYYRVPVETRAR